MELIKTYDDFLEERCYAHEGRMIEMTENTAKFLNHQLECMAKGLDTNNKIRKDYQKYADNCRYTNITYTIKLYRQMLKMTRDRNYRRRLKTKIYNLSIELNNFITNSFAITK